MRKMGTVLLAALVFFFVALPAALWLLQEKLIFFPQPLSEAQRAEVIRRFPFTREVTLTTADGARIHAWHIPGPRPDAPLVLYFGGNAEDVAWMIPDASTRLPGAAWLLVDYRGYGGSDGSPTEAAISADALAWYDYAARELKPARIDVFGRSLGSGAAVLVSSQRPVSRVVLVTPFDSLIEVAKRHYPFLPVRLMLRHQFDSIGRAPKITAPLLCLAAQRDTVVPSAHAKKLYDAWGGPKKWVELEEAGHNTTDSHPLFWRAVGEFLK